MRIISGANKGKKLIMPNDKSTRPLKDMAKEFKKGTSLALMIDQRVSEGPRISLFNNGAHTTTLPAQLSLKYNLGLLFALASLVLLGTVNGNPVCAAVKAPVFTLTV